jgi:hypothetical protein
MKGKSKELYNSRAGQVIQDYLTTEFLREYYRDRHGKTTRYAKHFDFLIALGSAGSGGSGLGILGDPRFAWLCGIVTTVSFILSAAKSQYDWQGRVQNSLKMEEFYGPISTKYKHIIDDMNVARAWNEDFEQRYLTLREEAEHSPQDPYPSYPDKALRVIQNRVKAQIPYERWWTP